MNKRCVSAKILRSAPAVFTSFTVMISLFMGGNAILSPSFAQAKKQPAATNTPAKENKTAPNAASAGAAGSQAFLIGTFNEWKALMAGQNKQKLCYALSQPKERLPAKLSRDPGYAFITSRMNDGVRNEIAFKLGFSTKNGQEGVLTLGTTQFTLVSSEDKAFLKNPAQETQVIDLMKKNQSMVVKMASARGNETTDKYLLAGISKALEAVARECP